MRLPVLMLAALILSGSLSYAGDLKGMLKPFGNNTKLELYRYDKETKFYRNLKRFTPDKSGKFIRKNIQPGKYILTITSNGYADTEVGPFSIGKDIKSLGVINLQREAKISGKISPFTPDMPVRLYVFNENDLPPIESDRTKYADISDDGKFVIGGLSKGDYTLTFEGPEILGFHKEIHVKTGEKVVVPIIKPEKTGKISGKIAFPENSSKELWTVFAAKTDLYQPFPPLDLEYSEWQSASKCSYDTGEYTIYHLPAGRYKLAIISTGELVSGNKDLIKGEPSEADASAIKGLIASLSDAFGKGDLEAAKKLIAAKCIFSIEEPIDDTAEFINRRKEHNVATGKREAFLLRANENTALAYTRASVKIDKTKMTGREAWPYNEMPFDPERVEKWVFIRAGSEWKLSEYKIDTWLTDALNVFRLVYSPIGENGYKQDVEPSKLPRPLNLVLTDDPKIADIEVKAGETAKGHDLTIKFPMKP